jgi:alpha-L-fucosidase
LLKGKMIGWGGGGGRRFSADVTLQAGKRHTFRLEYRARGAQQSIQLMWRSARQIPEIIPQSQLFPGKGLNQKVYLPAARR